MDATCSRRALLFLLLFFLLLFLSKELKRHSSHQSREPFCHYPEVDMSSSLSSRASISSTTTSFHSSRQLAVSHSSSGTSRRSFVVSNAAQISFVRDSVETCVPDVKLTKSRDGTSGTAFFTFENPDVFEGASGDITGMYMADEEGEMTTVRGRL